MLDLFTLSLSMGMNTDLDKMRAESGATGTCNNEENVQQQEQPSSEEPAILETAAGVVDGAVQAVENVAVAAANTLCPSWTMVETVMESIPVAPVVDLSLPTAPAAPKKK